MALYRNIGATHPRRHSAPIFRDQTWTFDTSILRGDIFEPTPIELTRFRHKFREVERKAYPPMPGAIEEPDSEPDPEVRDVVDVEIYRVTGTDSYALPNGSIVDKAEAEVALGVTGGDSHG